LVKHFISKTILHELECSQCTAKEAMERGFKLTEEKLAANDIAATSGTTASVVIIDKSKSNTFLQRFPILLETAVASNLVYIRLH
jgi:hypothetical protein